MHKGLVTGVIFSGLGLSASIINFIVKNIVNPDNIKPIKGIYPPEVYANIPRYIIILITIQGSIFILSLALFRKFPEVESTETAESLELKNALNNPAEEEKSSTLIELIYNKSTIFYMVLAYSLYCKLK